MKIQLSSDLHIVQWLVALDSCSEAGTTMILGQNDKNGGLHNFNYFYKLN
jgi:hypothetical protein